MVEAGQEAARRARAGAGKERFGGAGSSVSAPAPIAGLKLTKSWVEQHAPEILDLTSKTEHTPGGGRLRRLQAMVEGPDGSEEHTETVHYSPSAVLDARRQADKERRREERAVLALAFRPKRQRLEAHIEYEQQTASELEVERRWMEQQLRRLSEAALQPCEMAGGLVVWLPTSLLNRRRCSFLDREDQHVLRQPLLGRAEALPRARLLCLLQRARLPLWGSSAEPTSASNQDAAHQRSCARQMNALCATCRTKISGLARCRGVSIARPSEYGGAVVGCGAAS